MRRTRPHVVGGLKHPTTTASAIALGVYSDISGNRARFTTAVEAQGGEVLWCRQYPQPAATCTGAQVATAVNSVASLGLKSYCSFRSSFSWANVASGSDDARWTSIGTALGGITPAGAWCFNHEPENDPADPNKGSNANGDLFCAAFDQVASIIKPLAPDWLASPCLFDEVFPSYEFSRDPGKWVASPDPNHWIPSETELLGVDYYAYRGASDAGSHWATSTFVYDHATAIADFLTYADARSVQLCFPEFAYAIRDPASAPTDVNNQIAWFADIADTWAGDGRISSIMHFEVNEDDGTGKANYAITDTTKPPINTSVVSAFVDIGA